MFDFRLPIECDRVHTTLAEVAERQCDRSLSVAVPRPCMVRLFGYSQAIPSPSRSRWDPYPGSPLRTGAAPASRAAVQFSKNVDEPDELLDDPLVVPLDDEPDPVDPELDELEDF